MPSKSSHLIMILHISIIGGQFQRSITKREKKIEKKLIQTFDEKNENIINRNKFMSKILNRQCRNIISYLI